MDSQPVVKVVILFDEQSGRVVRSYSENQEAYNIVMSQPDQYPNCARHVVEIGPTTSFANSPADQIAADILGSLGDWEGFDDLISDTDESTLSEIKEHISDAIKRHIIRPKVSTGKFIPSKRK